MALKPPHDGSDENTSSSSSSTSTITTIHPDIIHTHILTRLDGATLATTSAVSSHLRHLCSDDHLWQSICTSTWPSLMDPTIRHVISSTFPNGHHSIFLDAFPSLHHHHNHNHHHRPSQLSKELISAVDIYYKGNPIFSRLQQTNTNKNYFLQSPLWFDILEPDEFVQTPVKFVSKNEEWIRHLQQTFTLSWILIDPHRKRAANLSSRRPVSVQRHWLTRDLEIVYAVVMAAAGTEEKVRCVVKVTCGGKVGGVLHVTDVNMVMEDMDGKKVKGKEGVMILQNAMENGERKRVDADGVGAMEMYEKFSCMMKERREMKHEREKTRDVVLMLLAFIALVFFCFLFGF